MSKDPFRFRDSYDRYYIDVGTGERVYASDGSWLPTMVKAAMLIVVTTVLVML